MRQDRYFMGRSQEEIDESIYEALIKYGSRRQFSSFHALPERAGFPRNVQRYLEEYHGITGMLKCLSPGTEQAIFEIPNTDNAYSITRRDIQDAVKILHLAREEILGSLPSTTSGTLAQFAGEYEMQDTDTMKVNADRNEMLALIQAAKGMKFVALNGKGSEIAKASPEHVWRDGDLVVTLFNKTMQVRKIISTLDGPPTSQHFDYTTQIPHVVYVLPAALGQQIADMEDKVIRMITQSESQDRIERLTRQLGISLDEIDISLSLPKPEAE